jgi:indolepyruvate decarboxylase
MPNKKVTPVAKKVPHRSRTAGAVSVRDTVSLPLGQYLIRRLYDLGARHVFGIPGDYVLGFYKLLENSPLELVGTTTELSAGYAADAYARIKGIGVACVTYGVGGFSIVNAVACAYAEESPVVVISGAPGLRERGPHQYLHHVVRSFETQREVFRHLTVASAALEDPLTAFREIDRVLFACTRYKRPVYIELPRDIIETRPLYQHCPFLEKTSQRSECPAGSSLGSPGDASAKHPANHPGWR